MSRRCGICVGSLLLVLATFCAAAATPKRVLMLFREDSQVPATRMIDQAVREQLQTADVGGIEFYAEYLDANRFPDERHYRLFREYLREKYAQRRPDVVLMVLTPAFDLAGAPPADLLPGVPAVFIAVNATALAGQSLGTNVTGVVARPDLKGTLDVIFRLQPDTRRIVVIGGIAAMDRMALAQAERASRAFAGRAEFEFWTNRPMADLRSAVAALPPRSVVLFASIFRDVAGQAIFPAQAVESLVEKASVPVYVWTDTHLGSGALGGSVVHYDELGAWAGKATLRILNGVSASSQPISVLTNGTPVFDWRALRRWGISDGLLPPGSVILFRQPTVWELYRRQIIGVISICFLEAVLIILLAANLVRRWRAERALRDLSGRLINAQEEARARLARELHDDITQRLACLAIDVGRFELGAAEVSRAKTAREVREVLVQLSEDVQALSYRLHPSIIEDLGLAAALKAESERFTRQESIPVEVKVRDLPEPVPREVALGLFRVAQEALRNAARHAQARSVQVTLQGLDGGLQLAVQDDGRGFNPALQRDRPSLGLASMRERIHLLQGELDIDSAPGQGTTIVAWVPLNALNL